jgi:DNA polymerase-1
VLIEYKLVAKRLEQLVESKKNNSWMQHATQDRLDGGKMTGLYHVHGAINQSGAVTHRATHFKPNMSAVPKVTKPYGPECRELFLSRVDGDARSGCVRSGAT